MKRIIRIGLDIGSTTVKVAILDNEHVLLHKQYERHFSEVSRTVCKIMDGVAQKFSDSDATISITGSSDMAVADRFELDFTQEVFACSQAIERFIPQTDVAIELGGEDTKITYWENLGVHLPDTAQSKACPARAGVTTTPGWRAFSLP